MNSHVLLKLGVAYKASLKHIVQFLILSVVFSGIIQMANSAATDIADFSDVKLPHEKERTNQTKFLFLTAKNNMWLEILPNGTVWANTCPTKYGALIDRSHSTTKTVSFSGQKNDDQAAVFLKGAEANRYLCVNAKGHVYAAIEFNEDDCRFLQKPKFETAGSTVHYYKHNKHKYRAKKKKSGHRRFQLGFRTDGTVYVVKHFKDLKKNITEEISINRRIEDISDLKTYTKECPLKVKRRFKFCRTVWKNFFNADIKDLKRFRIYNCWEKLRQHKQVQSNKGGTG